MIAVLDPAFWIAIPPIILGNGLPEAAAAAILVVSVASIWMRIERGGEKQGSSL
jgi:hypothetical protein